MNRSGYNLAAWYRIVRFDFPALPFSRVGSSGAATPSVAPYSTQPDEALTKIVWCLKNHENMGMCFCAHDH